jgi:hypothetical protein
MAHFAKLGINNVVLEVLTMDNIETVDRQTLVEDENIGIAKLQKETGHLNWKQTSYNGRFRKQYAGIGSTYNSELDIFILPKPFASWTLDSNGDWQPPVARPADFVGVNQGGNYKWNEETQTWDVNSTYIPFTP